MVTFRKYKMWINPLLKEAWVLSAVNKFRQKDHPELRPGEVWFCNSTKEGFDKCEYVSKRLGEKAYNRNNDAILCSNIHQLYPVFVSIEEHNKRSRRC